MSHSRHQRRFHSPDRKLMQLCAQVADTLNQVLGGECNDEILRSLYVAEVSPAPDSTQLMVVVVPSLADEAMPPAEVLARLHAKTPQLRYEVGNAITRRRVPRLLFQYGGADYQTPTPNPAP